MISLLRATLVTSLLALALSVAAAGAQAAGGPMGSLPAGWSHASINVVIRHQPHTLTYDRGRVQSVTASSLTLLERDGEVQTISVSAATKLTIDGRPATIDQVRPREQATTMVIDGAAASFVQVLIPPALAAELARQAARQAKAGRQ